MKLLSYLEQSSHILYIKEYNGDHDSS